MLKDLNSSFLVTAREFFRSRFRKFAEINRKYSQPRIRMTPLVRVSLFLLRLYLISMVIILVYKFISVATK
jgi:hypothetical protein